MNIAFTICSNNYLAQAKIVADSFLQYHPDFKFVIGLVDKYATGSDYSFLKAIDVTLVEELNIENFESLIEKYNIMELNTVVKPSYFKYFFEQFKADKVIYLDPDTMVASRFDELIDILDTNNIVITPHMCTPVDDGYSPSDYQALRGGVFNLGFIGLSSYDKVQSFLDWWHDRVVKYGLGNHSLNMFYDQLWINYVPCFFDNYHILKHPGYNMAHWNLHERKLGVGSNKTFLVNETYPLRFFHFSGYSYKKPDVICTYAFRYDFVSRPDLAILFNEYNSLEHSNNIKDISKLPVWYYPDLHKQKPIRGQQERNNLFDRLKWRVTRAFEILTRGK